MTSTPKDRRDAFFDVRGLEEGAGQRAGRASVLILGVSLLKILLQLGSVIVMARLIPPAEYGIAAMALPVAIIVANMSQFGLAQPIVQMPVVNHYLASTLFWVNVALGILFGGLLAAGSGVASRFYGVPEVGPVFIVLGVSVIFSSILTLYVAIIRRRLQVRLLEYGLLASFFLSIVIAVIAALLGASYWAVIIQHISQPILSVAIYAIILGWYPSPPWKADLDKARSALNFGGSVALSDLLQQIGQALPVMMIGRYYTPFDAGLYQRSNTLARLLPARIVSPLGAVFMSTLSRLQDDAPAFRAMFLRMISRLNLILMPIGIIGFTTADIFIPLVLGDEWAPAAPVMAWLCLMILQNPIDQGITWALNATGASRQIRQYGFISLGVVIVILAAVGFDHEIEFLAAAIVLGNMLLRLPVGIYLCLGHTYVDMRTILHGYVLDLGLAGVSIFLVLWLRNFIGMASDAMHILSVFALLSIIYATRIMMDQELRADVAKVLSRRSVK